VNANLAAMVADPEDLLHGREGAVVIDPRTATRAVDVYRSKAPSGSGDLKDVSPKGGK
jgi:pilus assembly protein CpaD